MKKKILLVVVTLVVSTVILTACNLISGKSSTYDELNEMVEMEYDSISMETQTTYNGVTLVNKYQANKGANSTMISYATESLATIEKNENGDYVVPSDMIIKKSGSANVVDGVVTEQSGDSVDLPIENLESIKIKFDENAFGEEKTYAEGAYSVFEAEVVKPWIFVDNPSFDGKDMRVTVRYAEKLSSVVISYTSRNGASVNVVYNFR